MRFSNFGNLMAFLKPMPLACIKTLIDQMNVNVNYLYCKAIYEKQKERNEKAICKWLGRYKSHFELYPKYSMKIPQRLPTLVEN